jgi:hypothetical protein
MFPSFQGTYVSIDEIEQKFYYMYQLYMGFGIVVDDVIIKGFIEVHYHLDTTLTQERCYELVAIRTLEQPLPEEYLQVIKEDAHKVIHSFQEYLFEQEMKSRLPHIKNPSFDNKLKEGRIEAKFYLKGENYQYSTFFMKLHYNEETQTWRYFHLEEYREKDDLWSFYKPSIGGFSFEDQVFDTLLDYLQQTSRLRVFLISLGKEREYNTVVYPLLKEKREPNDDL